MTTKSCIKCICTKKRKLLSNGNIKLPSITKSFKRKTICSHQSFEMNINVDIVFDDSNMIVSRFITDVYINNVIIIKRNRLYLF